MQASWGWLDSPGTVLYIYIYIHTRDMPFVGSCCQQTWHSKEFTRIALVRQIHHTGMMFPEMWGAWAIKRAQRGDVLSSSKVRCCTP